jgi:hypothetical protein
MKIVGIHGMLHTYIGRHQIKEQWLPAINDGLSEAGEASLEPSDFEIVSYGQLSRPSSHRGDADDRIDLNSLTKTDLSPAEKEIMSLMWEEASRLARISTNPKKDEDDSIQSPNTVGRAVPEWLQNCVANLTKSRFIRGFGPERLLPFLREVFRFLQDPNFKATVLERVATVVSDETRVLLAHSLGSIVAYEALCANQHWRIETFITLGSPLGIRNYVFDTLTPKPSKHMGIWPDHIKHWVNISDSGDIVALSKRLAPLFGNVEDVMVYNGWESHNVLRYLSAKETGTTLGRALKNN